MEIRRAVYERLKGNLRQYPAVAILGARQVGKTTLAKAYAKATTKAVTYIDLENRRDVVRLADPMAFLESVADHLVIIDEVQRQPELFQLLRVLIDADRRKGRFLLLGSSSPSIIREAAESLSGRIAYSDLYPLNIEEVGFSAYEQLWQRGGYPDAFLAETDSDAYAWQANYLRNLTERDLPMLGLGTDPKQTERLLRMLSSVQGTPLNMAMLGKSLELTGPTIKRYLSYLDQAFVTFQLPSYHINIRKRLTKASKVYVLDSGMLHYMLGVKDQLALRSKPIQGNSWEGFVIQQIRARAPLGDRHYFYRTQDGSEVDLVIVRGTEPIAAIEIKMTNAPVLSKGNRLAFEAVNAPLNLVLTPSAEDFPMGGGIEVCSLRTVWEKLGVGA